MTREERLEYMRNWHRTHPERSKAYNRKYVAAHREQVNANQRRNSKRYYATNPEHFRQLARNNARKAHDAVIDLLGGKCVGCGIIDKRILQVNHINNGGVRDFKQYSGPLGFYNAILKGRRIHDDLDIRCANCNILYKWKDKDRQ